MLDGAWSGLLLSGSRAQGGHRKWRRVAREGEHLLHWLLVTHAHTHTIMLSNKKEEWTFRNTKTLKY